MKELIEELIKEYEKEANIKSQCLLGLSDEEIAGAEARAYAYSDVIEDLRSLLRNLEEINELV